MRIPTNAEKIRKVNIVPRSSGKLGTTEYYWGKNPSQLLKKKPAYAFSNET